MDFSPVQILDEVSRTGIDLLLKEPYYAHLLINLNKRVDTETVDTLAVGAEGNHFVLFINPVFWNEVLTSREYRYGVVKHEVLHLLFGHVTRSREFANQSVYNIAADILVNQYIIPEQLPAGAILLSGFPELALEPEQTVDYYYWRLIELTHSEDGQRQAPEAYQYLKKSLDQAAGSHALWEKITRSSPVDQQLLDIELNNLVRIAANRTGNKARGELPAAILRHLASFETRHTPLLNWRKVLRQFTGSSSRTFLRNTPKKGSKRYGTAPGIRIQRRRKIMVALDTSGSISPEELSRFFGEIYHIWKRGAEIQVVECDSAIGRIYPYKGCQPGHISGGGGTCFTAPVLYANEKYCPDAIVYFTDGFGPRPAVPSRSPLLWLISQRGLHPGEPHWDDLPGHKIKMHE